MKYDIILCGVGGQGILSLSAVLLKAAVAEGLFVRQSEIHGMAQRGGAVQAHVRVSSSPIASHLIGKGQADMILATEPLELLRYLDRVRPDGAVISSSDPFRNIDNYPDMDHILDLYRQMPHSLLVPAQNLAREAGSIKVTNMVLLGSAASSLPLGDDALLQALAELLASKGETVQDINTRAFQLGQREAQGEHI